MIRFLGFISLILIFSCTSRTKNTHIHDVDSLIQDTLASKDEIIKPTDNIESPDYNDTLIVDSNLETDDCIFDQSTQTDEFLQNIPELAGYVWNDNSKTATVVLGKGDTLLITRGGCYHFGVTAEFRLHNDKRDYSDWENVYDKVFWISKILTSEFNYELIKNDIDSNKLSIEGDGDAEILYFENEYLQMNNYSIERNLQNKLKIISLNKYID